MWENCISVCTDGAAAMVGRTKSFVSRVKDKNKTNVIITQCFLHREAFIARTLPADLVHVLGDVHIVNFVKSQPLKSHMFASFYVEMGAEHKLLLMVVAWQRAGLRV